MKKIPFIKFSLCLLFVLSGYAQKSKTYTESFNVNKDTEVSLKADHAEIIIETWNKSRVDVEATITVDVEDEKLANKILENFEFEALGNSSKVEIRAGRKGTNVYAGSVHFFPEGEIEVLTEDIKGIEAPPAPPLPPLPPSVGNIDMDFDMERFNEEGKAYIIEFQKEIREMFEDSNFKEEMQEWKDKFKEEMEKSGLKDSIRVLTYKLKDEIRPALREMRKELEEQRAELQEERSHLNGFRADHKVKKKIIIKMPKDAKLDLDVKRSELKIASLNQIDANLNYSGLQIDELSGKNCSVSASHSNVAITKANELNLNIKYAKRVNIGEVNDLISTSKTSNLVIDLVNQKALIDGSFGDLVIKDINQNFNLIDINLKNSKAKVNVPDVSYNFYINSKSSEVNLDSGLEYKVSEAFDAKIYQNKNSQNTSRVLNIKADYSRFELH
ncbi:MAG: hypothetical protein GVY05_05915 [Bacteroidetes bacterium]|jgi:hypothetical protein|nr:hypothetical protein [Bacteroidota bacterium]